MFYTLLTFRRGKTNFTHIYVTRIQIVPVYSEFKYLVRKWLNSFWYQSLFVSSENNGGRNSSSHFVAPVYKHIRCLMFC